MPAASRSSAAGTRDSRPPWPTSRRDPITACGWTQFGGEQHTDTWPRTPRTSAMRRLSPCKTAAKCLRRHQSPTDGDRERRRRPHAQGPAGRSSALCASPTSVLCLAVLHYFIVLNCPFILSKRFLYFVCSDVLTMLLSALTSILPINSNLDSR